MDARTTPKESLSHTRADIRDALAHIKRISAAKARTEGWYGLDRQFAPEYFGTFSKWLDEIRVYFESLRIRGEKIVYVDVAGRAESHWLEADEDYSFSFQPLDASEYRGGIRIHGDFFSSRGYGAFLKQLADAGDYPALVTFEPVLGMSTYEVHKWQKNVPPLLYQTVFQRIRRNLIKTITVLKPGGYLFCTPPFPMRVDWEEKLWMEEICREHNCYLRTEYRWHVHWLLQKRISR